MRIRDCASAGDISHVIASRYCRKCTTRATYVAPRMSIVADTTSSGGRRYKGASPGTYAHSPRYERNLNVVRTRLISGPTASKPPARRRSSRRRSARQPLIPEVLCSRKQLARRHLLDISTWRDRPRRWPLYSRSPTAPAGKRLRQPAGGCAAVTGADRDLSGAGWPASDSRRSWFGVLQ